MTQSYSTILEPLFAPWAEPNAHRVRLEVAVAKFCDRAPDVAAFAKNAGSQCLRVDRDTGRSIWMAELAVDNEFVENYDRWPILVKKDIAS
jgi:hypothetical protein